MVMELAKDCSIDGDLEQAVLQIQQTVSDQTQALILQIQALPVDLTDINNLNAALTVLAQTAPTPVDPSTLAAQTGLLPPVPTQQDDEQRLELLGLVLIDGILYLADASGNIDALRRLYFALGSDVTKLQSVLLSQAPFVVIQTLLRVQALPLGPVWTLAAARTTLLNPAIEKIYTAADGVTYCVVPEYLDMNVSTDKVIRENGITDPETVQTQLFWFTAIKQDSGTVQSLKRLGIVGDYLTSALLGQRLSDLKASVVSTDQTAANIQIGVATQQLQTLLGRFFQVGTDGQMAYLAESIQTTQNAFDAWLQMEQDVRFWPTLIQDPTVVQKFLVNNTTDDLVEILTNRPNVTGMTIPSDPAAIQAKLQQVLSINSSSSTVSTLVLNQSQPTIDSLVDAANQSLTSTQCGLNQMSQVPVLFNSLQTAMTCLQSSTQGTQPAVAVQTTPTQGYACYDSPATVVFRQVNFDASFNTDGILAEISTLAQPLTFALKAVVLAIVTVLNTLKGLINSVLGAFQATVTAFTQQLEALLSRYMSFFGTASLNSSILKCSLGYNLNASLPILDEISGLVDLLRRNLQNLLSAFAKTINTLITQIICAPINLLNGLVSQATSALPSFCQVAKVQLPQDIEALLQQLRNGFLMQSTSVTAFARDAIKIRGTVTALPLKLNTFQDALSCQSTAYQNFFQSATSSLNLGIGSNPVAGVAAAL